MVKYWGDKDIIFGVVLLIKIFILGMFMKNIKSFVFLCIIKFLIKLNEYFFILMKFLLIKY